MKLNTPIHYFPILCINILFTISYSQMERASLFDMEEIHALRADISRDLIIEQPDGSQRNMSRCDFVVLNPDAAHIDPETIDQWNNLHRSSILTIPVAFHIIHKTDNDNTGYIEQSKLEAQISSLNAAYASLDIQFQLSSVDYTANDDWFGIACGSFNESECGTHPNHCNWYSDSEPQCQENNTFEDTYKSTLVVNHATTLNIYSGELGGTLGYAYLPTDLASIPSYMDGVVLHYPTLEEIGDSNSPYNEGDTGIHEVGHYLGLHHTFHGGCDAGQCNGLSTTCLETEGCIINVSDMCVYGGDEVADTPEQDYGDNIYECLEADTCPSDPGNDPIHNYMNYVEDYCMNEFTSDQKERMVAMIGQYRQSLGSDGNGDDDGGDEGPPDCLSGCDGINDIDGDDPMQVCALLDSIWDETGSCADDCEDDEELNMIAYMCEGCFDASVPSDTTCVAWFDFDDPCSECHEACDDVGGNGDEACHDDCDEGDDCACDVDDPCCHCHETCHVVHNDCIGSCDASDNSCINACDNAIDECSQDCDTNDCGPPECLAECEGIDDVDTEGDASGFCTWLTATGTDISSCSSGCGDELLTELDMMSWMCTGCLTEDPDGNMGTCGYWLDFKGDDPCDQCHEACDDVGGNGDEACHADCEYDCGGEGDEDDCNYDGQTACEDTGYCEWDAEDGGYCDDCAYDGATKCIRDCTGVCGVDPVTDPVGYCDWFGDLMDNNQTENGLTGCLADCGEDSDFEIPHLNMIEWVCSECNAIEDDNCQWISHTVSDPDKRCGGYNTSGECTSNTFCAWDNTDEGYCDEADCEYGGYGEGECNGYSQCAWDADDESGTCHFYDPHECLHGCTGDEAPPASPTPNQHCAWLIGVWDENGCTSECDFLVNVEYSICNECYIGENNEGNECDAWFYFDGGGDDCNQYTSADECPLDHCWWDPNAGTAGECHQEGPPDCVNDCAGFSSMTPQTSHTDWCTWLSNVWENGSASCMTDCNADDMTKLTADVSDCTTCLANNDCDQVDDCNQYTSADECPLDHCWWDAEAGDSGECIHDEGPPECLKNCDQGFETLSENSTDEEFCDVLTTANTTECGCSEEELSDIDCFSYMCGGLEYMDEEIEIEEPPVCMAGCLATDCGFSPDFEGDLCEMLDCLESSGCMASCTDNDTAMFDGIAYFCDAPDGCEEFFDMGDEEGEDGPPDCLSECEGIGDVDLEVDPRAFCEWIILTIGDSNCAQDCDADATAEITDMFNLCTTCLAGGEGACDEAYLSTDEKNLLLPEEFTLHPVYPNPFNPTTDIGFSLELAGPVSISVYDVTGRQIETMLHNEFRNAGSYIINWNGSQFPSGIYFIHLQAGKQIEKQKITLLK